jgi:hypothetical protein
MSTSVFRGGKTSARKEAGGGEVPGGIDWKAAISLFWILRKGGTELSRGGWWQRPMDRD